MEVSVEEDVLELIPLLLDDVEAEDEVLDELTLDDDEDETDELVEGVPQEASNVSEDSTPRTSRIGFFIYDFPFSASTLRRKRKFCAWQHPNYTEEGINT